ncbi:MAG: uncharacterized protein A8A55_2521 [Amphiamblys sp. WSBS2006]|nr:MAG: uncharacterized protein A8A55_2521 [Amphiamblys sp. WSBS2006]
MITEKYMRCCSKSTQKPFWSHSTPPCTERAAPVFMAGEMVDGRTRWDAPKTEDNSAEDVLDTALFIFRANHSPVETAHSHKTGFIGRVLVFSSKMAVGYFPLFDKGFRPEQNISGPRVFSRRNDFQRFDDSVPHTLTKRIDLRWSAGALERDKRNRASRKQTPEKGGSAKDL